MVTSKEKEEYIVLAVSMCPDTILQSFRSVDGDARWTISLTRSVRVAFGPHGAY